MIPTKTRLQYANGYLELGMLDDASDELEAIEGDSFLPLRMHSSPPIPERLNRTLIRGWNEGGISEGDLKKAL
jgi:hypothetical protein